MLPERRDGDRHRVRQPALQQVLLLYEGAELVRESAGARHPECRREMLDRKVLRHLIGDDPDAGDQREELPLGNAVLHQPSLTAR